jgi:hypothetical protein
MLYFIGLIFFLVIFLLLFISSKKNKKRINNDNKPKSLESLNSLDSLDSFDLFITVIDNLNCISKVLKINMNDIEKLYYLKKCNDIHLEIIDNNQDIIETLSIVNGRRNYTFFPIKMEYALMKKYLNSRVSYEIISEINTLNTIYNLGVEIKKNNKVICRGYLSNYIDLYKNNDKFIIQLYKIKYIIDMNCLITLLEVKFFPNKSYIC